MVQLILQPKQCSMPIHASILRHSQVTSMNALVWHVGIIQPLSSWISTEKEHLTCHLSVGIDQIEIMCFEQINHSEWLDTACAYLATGGLYLIFSIIQVVLLIFFPFCMLLVSDIKPPPKDLRGHMDMDDFWDKLTLQMIGRGFVKVILLLLCASS